MCIVIQYNYTMVVLVSDATLHEINNCFTHLDDAETSADFTSGP